MMMPTKRPSRATRRTRTALGSLAVAALVALAAAPGCSSFSEASASPDAAIDAMPGDGGDAGPPGPVLDGGLDAAVVPDGAPPRPCGSNGVRGCTDRYVFRTPDTLRGDFATTEASKTVTQIADAFCRAQADTLGEDHPDLVGRTWKAFLCTSTVDAMGRLASSPARWITPQGTVVFAGTADIPGGLAAPIGAAGRVWTGCTATGMRGATACKDWALAMPSVLGAAGEASAVSAAWVRIADNECTAGLPLYCFEDGPP